MMCCDERSSHGSNYHVGGDPSGTSRNRCSLLLYIAVQRYIPYTVYISYMVRRVEYPHKHNCMEVTHTATAC